MVTRSPCLKHRVRWVAGSTELALPIPFQFGLSGLPIYVQGLALDAGASGGAVLTPAAATSVF